MPGDMSTIRSQHNSRGSMSESAASPSRSSISVSQLQPSSASGLPQPSGAMSIGSIIEHDIHGEYKSHSVPNLLDISQQPIGTAPRSLRPELLYGVSPSGDSPLYSSSDSCYSPISDYLQPPSQTVHPGFYSPDLIQRPHSATAIECYQPMLNSPLSVGPPTPAWSTYDPSALGYAPEAPCVPSVSSDPSFQSRKKRNRIPKLSLNDSIGNTSTPLPRGVRAQIASRPTK